MPNVGFSSRKDAERAAVVVRAAEARGAGPAAVPAVAPGSVVCGLVTVTAGYDAAYARGVVCWWNPAAGAYTTGGDIMVRSSRVGAAPPAVGVQDGGWFSGVHPATGRGIYTVFGDEAAYPYPGGGGGGASYFDVLDSVACAGGRLQATYKRVTFVTGADGQITVTESDVPRYWCIKPGDIYEGVEPPEEYIGGPYDSAAEAAAYCTGP